MRLRLKDEQRLFRVRRDEHVRNAARGTAFDGFGTKHSRLRVHVAGLAAPMRLLEATARP